MQIKTMKEAKNIHHENIVEYHDHVYTDNEVYLIFELCDMTLSDHLY